MNKSERGATLVEGAIVIPIWILFFVAITDVYFMVSAYMNLTSFAREALYLGAIMDNKFITADKQTQGYCYMSGTASTINAAPPVTAVDPACSSYEYLPMSSDSTFSVQWRASECYVAPSQPTGSTPRAGRDCGHWLLHDKVYMLARADKLLNNSPQIGAFTGLYTVTRRGLLEATVLSTPLPSSSSYVSTKQNIPTLFVSSRGHYQGMFPMFNGIAIRTRVSGPHSSQLLPASDNEVIKVN